MGNLKSEIAGSKELLGIIREVERNPEVTQRELSRQMGISLGKINFLINALIDKGIVKAKNFKNSRNKLAYMYILTPRGIKEKSKITYRFLKRKLREYEMLKAEIEELQREVDKPSVGNKRKD